MFEGENPRVGQQPRAGGQRVVQVGTVRAGPDPRRAPDVTVPAVRAPLRSGVNRVPAHHEVDRPAVPAELGECAGDALAGRADGGEGKRRPLARGTEGVSGAPGKPDPPFVELVPRRKLVAGHRPVVRHPVLGEYPEVLRPIARRVRRPPERPAADAVSDEWLDRRLVVLDRVVRGRAPDVRIGVERAGVESGAFELVGGDDGVVEPPAALDACHAKVTPPPAARRQPRRSARRR